MCSSTTWLRSNVTPRRTVATPRGVAGFHLIERPDLVVLSAAGTVTTARLGLSRLYSWLSSRASVCTTVTPRVRPFLRNAYHP